MSSGVDNAKIQEDILNIGGEDVRFSFSRMSSKKYSNAHKSLKWFSFTNIRFIVYCAFMIILAIFGTYYIINAEYLFGVFAIVATAFMVYIIFFGYKLFTKSLDFDEENNKTEISCKITDKELYLYVGSQYECLPLTALKACVKNKMYMLLTFKSSNLCPDGLVFDAVGVNVDELKSLIGGKNMDLVKNEKQ